MKLEAWIDVAGVSASGLSPEVRALAAQAEVIAGGRRILALLGECSARKIELDGAILRDPSALVQALTGRRALVLASGDPLYNGIGGTLLNSFPPERLRFHPQVTAFQVLSAKLGIPWEKASHFSVHGKESLPWRRMLSSGLAVIYCDAKRSAQRIAAELIAAYPAGAGRRAAVGCDLGTESEWMESSTLGAIANDTRADHSLSILVLFPSSSAPELPLGLDDASYVHDGNVITHPEVRAVVLSKLRLHSGVMWDVGAGSGSVGLEAAGLCPTLQVYAVEQSASRVANIRCNAERESLENYHLCEGTFSGKEKELPDPDFVFVGGGGAELEEILKQSFARLAPGGVLAATAVLVESVCVLSSVLKEYRRELLTLNIARALPLAGSFCCKAENPVTLALFAKKGDL